MDHPLRRFRRWLKRNAKPVSPLEARAISVFAGGFAGLGALIAAFAGAVLTHRLVLALASSSDGSVPAIYDKADRLMWATGALFGVTAYGVLIAGRPWGAVLALAPLVGAALAFGGVALAPTPGGRHDAPFWAAVAGAFLGGIGSWPWRRPGDALPEEPLVDLRRSGRLRDRVSRSPRSNRACGFPAHG